MSMIPYKLRNWIDQDKLDWSNLSSNLHAIQLLEKNPDKIDWNMLSDNSNAMHLLEKNLDKVYWFMLSRNPEAMHLLKKNPDKIIWRQLQKNTNPEVITLLYPNADGLRPVAFGDDAGDPTSSVRALEQHPDKIHWDWLSLNSGAISLLEKNQDKIDWDGLSENTNAIHLLEKNPDKIDWKYLSENTNAIHLLEKNPDKIDWKTLSYNTSAIHILEKNQDKIDWTNLCFNSNAHQISGFEEKLDEMDWSNSSNSFLDFYVEDVVRMKYGLNRNPNMMNILKKHPERIDYRSLSENPSIFELDYDAMKETKHTLHEELIRTMLHPKNISKFEGWGFESGYDSESDSE